MGKRNSQPTVKYVPFGDLDLDEVVSCPLCHTVFVQPNGDEVCPRCAGKGLNPGPETEAGDSEVDEDFRQGPDFDQKGW